jgi:hypothetical protein
MLTSSSIFLHSNRCQETFNFLTVDEHTMSCDRVETQISWLGYYQSKILKFEDSTSMKYDDITKQAKNNFFVGKYLN